MFSIAFDLLCLFDTMLFYLALLQEVAYGFEVMVVHSVELYSLYLRFTRQQMIVLYTRYCVIL